MTQLSGPPLSAATRERLDLLFSDADRGLVADTLTEYCGHGLPGCGEPEHLELIERIRMGCLDRSEGNLDRLDELLEVAAADWRDLLAAAEGSSPTAEA
jgi:hypothetical protein